MSGREQLAQQQTGQDQQAARGQGVVEDAQRRLLLVLRAQHGPQAGTVWCGACSRAGVVSTGQLTADELDRVAAELAKGTGADAVAGRTCRVRLMFLRSSGGPAEPAAPARPAAVRPAPASPVPPVRSPLTAATTRPAAVRSARPAPVAVQVPAALPADALRDRDVRAAFRQPDALDEQAWLRRLAELESELA